MTTESGALIRGNRLLLDGRPLSLEAHSPRDLAYVLGSLGREAIVNAIEDSYTSMVEANPGAPVVRPSLYAVDLGASDKNILSDFGQRNRTRIHRSIIEVQPEIHDYWNTIRAVDFSPEIKSGMGSRKNPQNWLFLRNPETDPPLITPLDHLPNALGFIEPAVTTELKSQMAEAWSTHDTETYERLKNEYMDECQAAIDRQAESYGDQPSVRALAQVGYILAKANLMVEIEGDAYLLNPSRYETHLNDAFDYAFELHEDEVVEMILMEVARIRMLRDDE